MSKGGRPTLAVQSVRVQLTLTLRPGEDDDLIAFFEKVPVGGRAQAVIDALRGVGPAAPPVAEVGQGAGDGGETADAVAGVVEDGGEGGSTVEDELLSLLL